MLPLVIPCGLGVQSVPCVLVLLAAYNGEIWLREQLDSILSQEDVEVHILIGDDVSSDRTRDLLDDGWQDDPRVKVCAWNKSSGSAGANFRRLYIQADLTGFDFVALADQDDIWMPRKLISAVESLGRTGAQGYSCAVQAFWPDGREKVLNQNSSIRSADFLFEGAGQGCTFVVRRQLFERIQQFCAVNTAKTEALHYHDWLIYLLVRAWELPWYFDARPWMRYRQHSGNEIGSRGSMQAINRRLGMVKSGWYAAQVKAASDLYRLANGSNTTALSLSKLMASPHSLSRSTLLSFKLLKQGRRRLIDRCVLAATALVGWI